MSTIRSFIRERYGEPIFMSVVSLIITFTVSFTSLYFIRPKYIINVSKTGSKKINKYLLVTYSLLFSCLVAIIVLLLTLNKEVSTTSVYFVPKIKPNDDEK